MGNIGELDLYVTFAFLVGLVIGLLIGWFKRKECEEQRKLDEAFNVAIADIIEQPAYLEDEWEES